MPIGPMSEGSSNLDLYAHEEEGGVPPHSPDEQSLIGHFNEGSPIFPENPLGSASSLAKSIGADYGPPFANSGYDPSEIQERRINRALIGTPIENPEKVEAGITLHPALKESPNIAASEEQQGSQIAEGSKGPLGQAVGNALKKGTSLARRLSSARSNPTHQKQSPAELDANIRSREVAKRQRGLINMQDDPVDRETLQRLLGINRQNEDGSWE